MMRRLLLNLHLHLNKNAFHINSFFWVSFCLNLFTIWMTPILQRQTHFCLQVLSSTFPLILTFSVKPIVDYHQSLNPIPQISSQELTNK